MGDMIVKAALAYIEKHPDVIEEVLGALIKKIVEDLKKPKAA